MSFVEPAMTRIVYMYVTAALAVSIFLCACLLMRSDLLVDLHWSRCGFCESLQEARHLHSEENR